MDRRPSPAPAAAAQGDAGALARRQTLRDQVAAETGIDEAMIERLVRSFHARVREDALLAPIVGARKGDWEPDDRCRRGAAERDHHQRRQEHPGHQPEHLLESRGQGQPPDERGQLAARHLQRLRRIGGEAAAARSAEGRGR